MDRVAPHAHDTPPALDHGRGTRPRAGGAGWCRRRAVHVLDGRHHECDGGRVAVGAGDRGGRRLRAHRADAADERAVHGPGDERQHRAGRRRGRSCACSPQDFDATRTPTCRRRRTRRRTSRSRACTEPGCRSRRPCSSNSFTALDASPAGRHPPQARPDDGRQRTRHRAGGAVRRHLRDALRAACRSLLFVPQVDVAALGVFLWLSGPPPASPPSAPTCRARYVTPPSLPDWLRVGRGRRRAASPRRAFNQKLSLGRVDVYRDRRLPPTLPDAVAGTPYSTTVAGSGGPPRIRSPRPASRRGSRWPPTAR